MTHLDILAEPKRYDSDNERIPADFYYIASMVRATDTSGYLKSDGFTKRSIAIAFQSSSLMIPPALSFRFISYCLYVWAVKTYGEKNKDMLFHRSGVFTIDPSLDMYIICEDETIIARLVHARTNALIMRDLASSINECLTSALEKISQLYIRTSSDQNHTSDASFITRICCNAPDNPCIRDVSKQKMLAKYGYVLNMALNTKCKQSMLGSQERMKTCEQECPVTNAEFLKEKPTDLDLRRLSLLYMKNEIREFALQLGLNSEDFDNLLHIEETETWKFEVVRKCRNSFALTFRHIKELVKGDPIDFDKEPEKWDIVPTEKHIDKLAPLIGNNSLKFLIELEMEFNTWERINFRHTVERDLVKLNREILEEWRNTFVKCTI
ncbi:unnamed protein product [Mytilus edulis]|uniref:Uncharacterized protein n=1 Tax=Mytilus edulis TaxID=6550 RepID=A0A8S3RN81_MYTED|nr:unnamed protein product [Mytilus edulis]